MATTHDYYLKRQDIKVSGRREVVGTQDEKREGQKRQPMWEDRKEAPENTPNAGSLTGSGACPDSGTYPKERTDNRKRADKGSRCRNTGGQMKAYHLRWEKVRTTGLSRCPCVTWPRCPRLA